MKNNRWSHPVFTFAAALLAVFFASVFLPSVAHAAEAAVDLAQATAPALSWQQSLIPILTPLIIAGVKLAVPAIPRVWLPILAPVLGVALDLISGWATGSVSNPWIALALGAAGVGVREALNQARKSVATSVTPAPLDPTGSG